MNDVALWIGVAVGGVALLTAAVKGLVRVHKALNFIDEARDALPVLFDIADQFKPDHGHSLHDRIGGLEQGQKQIEIHLKHKDPAFVPWRRASW